MTKQEIMIATAREYLGTKWRHRGRNKRGIDCIGLVVVALDAADIRTNDRTNYGRNPWQDGLRGELRKHCGDPISEGNWQEGDIALLQWDNMPEPSHVAFLANYKFGGFSIIHSYSTIAVTEHRLDAIWHSRIIEVYRPWAA